MKIVDRRLHEVAKTWTSMACRLTKGLFAYSSSKAAALHLTQKMAYELGKDEIGVRVNNIAPIPTPTGMTGPVDDENIGSTQTRSSPWCTQQRVALRDDRKNVRRSPRHR
ncbi:uncharacterized protein BCR38DRAFT_416604 [Pseudomassariella vexata]|uniref:Uncharacterized protein n=1 Tax=Pseudomassariella vexata TaxID=1141098 RepID=A0A1Y2EII2_9PEZI|nr:uncharacterized protein BCR38DRAFT_416604 [Pseudomassariella vexata]ORY71373.1 hypothetical protein BCR38DRAFT_416604 [Pseudomassariella vexata]